MSDYLEEKRANGSPGAFRSAAADANAYIVGDLSSIACADLDIKKLRDWFRSLATRTFEASNFVRRASNQPITFNDGDADRKAKVRANCVLITRKSCSPPRVNPCESSNSRRPVSSIGGVGFRNIEREEPRAHPGLIKQAKGPALPDDTFNSTDGFEQKRLPALHLLAHGRHDMPQSRIGSGDDKHKQIGQFAIPTARTIPRAPSPRRPPAASPAMR